MEIAKGVSNWVSPRQMYEMPLLILDCGVDMIEPTKRLMKLLYPDFDKRLKEDLEEIEQKIKLLRK